MVALVFDRNRDRLHGCFRKTTAKQERKYAEEEDTIANFSERLFQFEEFKSSWRLGSSKTYPIDLDCRSLPAGN